MLGLIAKRTNSSFSSVCSTVYTTHPHPAAGTPQLTINPRKKRIFRSFRETVGIFREMAATQKHLMEKQKSADEGDDRWFWDQNQHEVFHSYIHLTKHRNQFSLPFQLLENLSISYQRSWAFRKTYKKFQYEKKLKCFKQSKLEQG